MSIPTMRPTFLLTVNLTQDQVIDKLRGLIDVAGERFAGKVVGRHVMLTVSEKDRHFWSPWLDVEVLERGVDEDDGEGDPADGGAVTVRGRFMPHPNIWTAYMAVYFGLVTFALFAACFAYAQWTTESPPTALWGVGFSALATAGVWWSAQVGQKLARGQMGELKFEFARVLEIESGEVLEMISKLKK